MTYSMEADVEAERLETQVRQSHYSLEDELGGFRFDPREVVMDAGCGTGVLARYLVEQKGLKRVDAVDASELRLKQGTRLLKDEVRQAIHFHKQDLASLGSEFQGRYDTVICRYVIEHVPDALAVLSQLRKALVNGGRLIVIDLDGVFVNLYSENSILKGYMNELKAALGFDLQIGRKVPNLLKRVGFSRVHWEARLLACQGKALQEEYENTQMRFAALGGFLLSVFRAPERCEEFKRLYLEEMLKEENTLVFTKYICMGSDS